MLFPAGYLLMIIFYSVKEEKVIRERLLAINSSEYSYFLKKMFCVLSHEPCFIIQAIAAFITDFINRNCLLHSLIYGV